MKLNKEFEKDNNNKKAEKNIENNWNVAGKFKNESKKFIKAIEKLADDLESINISHNALNSEAVGKLLDKLEKNQTLRCLNISGNNIKDKKVLAKLIKLLNEHSTLKTIE